MVELVVKLDNQMSLDRIKEAISLLKGVISVTIKEPSSIKSSNKLEDLPTDIQNLIGLATGITEKDIESDDRLAYILKK